MKDLLGQESIDVEVFDTILFTDSDKNWSVEFVPVVYPSVLHVVAHFQAIKLHAINVHLFSLSIYRRDGTK